MLGLNAGFRGVRHGSDIFTRRTAWVIAGVCLDNEGCQGTGLASSPHGPHFHPRGGVVHPVDHPHKFSSHTAAAGKTFTLIELPRLDARCAARVRELALFVRNAGKVLTDSQILREIWGPRMVKRLEDLRVYLKSLRNKIELNPDTPQLLVTERYIGYRLVVPEV